MSPETEKHARIFRRTDRKKILLSFENEAKPNTYFLFYVSVCVSIYVL